MTTTKKGRPPGSGLGLGEIESVRFTSDQLKVIEEVRRELKTTRSEVIRKATTMGLPLVRAAMKIFVENSGAQAQ
jgi:hypothetical protein